MNIVNWIELFAALTGIAVAMIVTIMPRFGKTSWTLALFLLLGSCAAGILGISPLIQMSVAESVFIAFQCLLLCGAAGCLASYSLGREDYAKHLRSHGWFFSVVAGAAVILTLAGLVNRPPLAETSQTFVALGPVGYWSALYLLLISVMSLANVEQTLRSTEEHIRWEIKFVWLGLGAGFGSLVYVASQVLIYPRQYSYLRAEAIHIFPIILLCSCLLIIQSWRRGTARSRTAVSHGVIYSTLTLVSVGGYLVVASLFSSWASHWTGTGLPTEAVVFLLSLIMLSVVFLATAFRHRARVWIRRHIFAGRYDYRQFWLAATDQIRANESMEPAATALVKLVQSAVGSTDVSVWVKSRNSENLKLIAVRGLITEQLPAEIHVSADALSNMTEPALVTDAAGRRLKEANPEFVQWTRAAIFAPLISSGRLVGLMTVGADRSGRSFDWQTREFVGAMAVHFANEFHKAELLSRLVEAREAEAFQTFSTFLLHDLKNFATTLSLITKNAARHKNNPDFQADAFQSILELSQKMKRLCNNLRTFSATMASHKTLDDLNQIVSSAASAFQASAGREVQLDLQPVPLIALDKEEIVSVLQNLILNAHEASSEHTPIHLKTRCEGRGIVLTVSDHGRGMSAEFIERAIFQPFQTTKSDGLGIGLFQSRKIVEAHDGRIEVESVLGSGTVFRIILPTGTTGNETVAADQQQGKDAKAAYSLSSAAAPSVT